MSFPEQGTLMISLAIGVGYSMQFFRKVSRLKSVIFFSVPLDILITSPKKFSQMVAPKNSPQVFSNQGVEGLFQPLALRAVFWCNHSKRFLRICDQYIKWD